MSSARDAVAEAIAQNRRLAASRLVRRDEIDAALAAETDEARRAALAAERVTVEAELAATLKEINELLRMARQAPAAAVSAAAAAEEDPLTPSAEMAALDNVRAHIRSLEAQVKVNEELRRVDEPEAPEDPPPPGPRKRTM
jgi:hypothetical protein